jgi:D-3-phosphoglycerate dehydrogenase
MVNAPLVAKERDIDITEIKHERASDYLTLVKVTVTTEVQTRSVSGTLFVGSRPRLVEIKGIPIDAELGPNMLYIANHDKPGFIGGLGTILGDEGINMATFHLGRGEPGGDAIALVEVDEQPSEEILKKIAALPQVVQVKTLRF